MSGQSLPAELPAPRRPWVKPTLTAHASLTALTQVQYPQGVGIDSIGVGAQSIQCSQGFCP